jgi:putative oxidoreductase
MDRHQVSLGLFFLRLLGGGLLIEGRSDSWSSMVRNSGGFLTDPFGVGGEFSWMLTMFCEFFCTILVMMGIFTRFTAVPPLVYMLVIALALPAGTTWSLRQDFLWFALPFFVLTFTGPGDYSVDGRMSAWASGR